MVFRLELGKDTTPGINRPQNEDHIGYYFPQQPEVLLLRGQMFIIADGNGEQGLGEFASKMAIQTVIQEYYEEPWVGTVDEMLSKSLLRANRTVYDANIENRSPVHFSTSLTCCVIHQEILYIAHIGNCCAYLLSDSNFEILTQSHSFDVDRGDRPIDIQGEENGKVLVRSLGIEEEVKIDMIQRKLQINDIILLCTDGVYTAIPEHEIQSIVASSLPQDACELIVKQALANKTPDDATAMLVKIKSIKRLEADEKPSATVVDHSQPAERQIVIKGVRYRSTWKEKKLSPPEEESVAEFSQDRDVRRPFVKRTTRPNWKRHFSIRQFLNIFTLLIVVAFIIVLIVKYGPKYWKSGIIPSVKTITTDTLRQISELKSEPPQQKEEIAQAPIDYAEVNQIEDTSKFALVEELEMPGSMALDIIIVDGSFRRNLSWNNYIDEMKRISGIDRISKVKSSFRLKKSKILWRRNADSEKENVIKERVDQYRRLFSQYFQVNANVQPLDLTLVLGADFTLPPLQTSYRDGQEMNNVKYYLEILNGYTVPGLARRLSEQLHKQKINKGQLEVIDYRNADKRSYRVSFIKCDQSCNDVAEELNRFLGQRLSIVNSRLFDIKLIVGTDIVF